MSEWRVVNLGSITSRIGDGLHGTPKYDKCGNYFFINGNNLINGRIAIKEDTKRVLQSEAEKYAKPLSENTVLLAINGTIGNLAFYRGEKCMLGKSACYINLSAEVDTKFMYYHFLNKDFQIFLESIATGTTIPNVPLKGIREYNFMLPNRHEQQAIAEILSSLDDKIDLLHRQNQTLEQMAETLFRQWFIEEAKEEWTLSTIGEELVTILGGTPSTKNPEYWDGNIPWINSGEINKFRIIEGSKFITELGLRKSNTKLLPKGSTVLAITGATLGQISFLEIDTCANQSVVAILPSDFFPSWFVFLWVKNKLPDIIMNETGGAQGHVNKNDINSTLIVKPHKDELTKAETIIQPMFEKISNNIWQIKNLEQQRDTLLPKLMSGEVRVKMN